MNPPPPPVTAVAEKRLQAAAWRVLLAAKTALRSDARDALAAAREKPPSGPRGAAPSHERAAFGIGAEGTRIPADGPVWLVWASDGWTVGPAAPSAARPLLELYAPVCSVAPECPITIAHLGQSLDGCIATASGDSYYVTGPDNVVHLHRLRALCDAVVVGASTIERDDPLLTVRHVEGESPVRVILDPTRRLGADRRVFAADAETLLIASAELADANAHGAATTVRAPCRNGRLDLRALLSELHRRGLFAVFVEGGGTTVSAFLEAGLLDRLQVAIAPLITGSGRPGLSLPARDKIADCLRPQHRVFRMGDDVLFDCDLRSTATASSGVSGTLQRVL